MTKEHAAKHVFQPTLARAFVCTFPLIIMVEHCVWADISAAVV